MVKAAEAIIPRARYISAFDTLKYLIKGGRAPKTAIIGELMGVKPFVTINNDTGMVESPCRVRGRKKAMLRLVDMVGEYADVSRPLHVNVHYTDNIDYGYELREMVTSRYNCEEVFFTDLTPVMTAHTGPSVALSFYS